MLGKCSLNRALCCDYEVIARESEARSGPSFQVDLDRLFPMYFAFNSDCQCKVLYIYFIGWYNIKMHKQHDDKKTVDLNHYIVTTLSFIGMSLHSYYSITGMMN